MCTLTSNIIARVLEGDCAVCTLTRNIIARVLEGGLCTLTRNIIARVLMEGLWAATVLVSFGVLLGMVNPLQLLVLALIETILFVVNCHIGYSILGCIDAGSVSFGKQRGEIFTAANLMKYLKNPY